MRSAALLLAALTISSSILGLSGVRAGEPEAFAPGHVPQPKGFHDGAMHGYTPNAIDGGTVVDTAKVASLVQSEHPLLIDVAEKDRKPPTMDKDMLWLPNHRSLPGAVFLQDGGRGGSDKAYAEAFRKRIAALTNGNKNKPIVTFCHPDCWGSWNAAKRLIEDGYTKVYWYPEGTEGWQADHDTRVVKPDAPWIESLPKDLTQ